MVAPAPGQEEKSSPHPWGCFVSLKSNAFQHWIFPTPVGVFQKGGMYDFLLLDLPHTRGGVSEVVRAFTPDNRSSPHPWGCFWAVPKSTARPLIFPTPVGVFPYAGLDLYRYTHLPHTRGGVSCSTLLIGGFNVSSPHPWGCFPCVNCDLIKGVIFPTPVGVFLLFVSCCWSVRNLPHTRGGVSSSSVRFHMGARSSPHPWGCFAL